MQNAAKSVSTTEQCLYESEPTQNIIHLVTQSSIDDDKDDYKTIQNSYNNEILETMPTEQHY